MKYQLEEILNEAIMTHVPVTIVEGKDDLSVYEKVASIAGKEDMLFYTVNTIDGLNNSKGNCDKVIECIELLQPKFGERPNNDKCIVGIIDRDARPYRQTMPNLVGLFILKYYAIEAYFANQLVLQKIVQKITYLHQRDIDEELLNSIEVDFEAEKEMLYYLSLEALQNACDNDYVGLIGYADNGIKNQTRRINLYNQIILQKKEDLDNFAMQKALNINDLKLIANAKWYLDIYLNLANESIKLLEKKCKNGEIEKCRSCNAGVIEECHYKYKQGYNVSSLINEAKGYVLEEEFVLLIDKFKAMSA